LAQLVDPHGAARRLVSCAADVLHPSGLPADLARGDGTTPDIDPRDYRLSQVGQLFAECQYRWRVSDDVFVAADEFATFLSNFYTTMPARHCAASLLMRLEDVTLIGGVLYAHAGGDSVVVYETQRPNDRDVIWMAPADKIAAANRKMFAPPGWRNFYLGSAGSFNYGHWLVDDLPRLKGILHLMALDPGPIRVLIESFGTAIDRVRIESIRTLIDSPIHVDLVARHEAYHFDTLYYPTPISEHPILKSPVALDFVARLAVQSAAIRTTDQGRADRLFVDRSATRGRTLANGAAVRDLVTRRGFKIVDPEGMSFVEQVRLFSQAQVVIGQMGAAMTNTLFCRPTAATVYLAPSGWIEPFYFDLAMARGHDYRVLFGPVTDPESPPHQSDFTIALDALEASIDRL